ncbi:thiazole-phosphate synthase [Desulfocicer vacuolatum DSM 3385]|uniref:Thiazole synthase n=1 Tax=Desulfocicer vacuolatum DSM 3385 TaxID=1121400 RepID=A0A1W2C0Z5_9BACT|nr:thiazole synthase [Desulfocicer vacuolatum]SMC78761.1 thiazole-phosphate synthase [Desulfocicer vacuolatum DSM 3385]
MEMTGKNNETMKMDDAFCLGGQTFNSRLLTGTGKFASREIIAPMLEGCGSEMITVALRRVDGDAGAKNILSYIPKGVTLLPNTSGARTAEEAVRIARIARAAGCGDFIKIEVITEMKYLMPDNYETLNATKTLAAEGFKVLPYIMPDLTLAHRLQDAGAAAVMPLGSPIGSNRGIKMEEMIRIIIESMDIPVIVDAGIGRPSQAAQAMEMGADAVLVNTAIATSADPVMAARAFAMGVAAGRMAFCADMAAQTNQAQASSPLTGFLRETA